MPRRKKLVDEIKEIQEKQADTSAPIIDTPIPVDNQKKPRKPKAEPIEEKVPEKSVPTKKSIASTVKAKDYSDSYSGIYKVTAKLLNMRQGPGMSASVLTVLRGGSLVSNNGYYTKVDNTEWLFVTYTDDKTNTVYSGYCNAEFLKK